MSVKYEITRWRSMFNASAAELSICYKAPRARNELWRMIYEMLEADGLLDRPCAHRLLAEFEACEVSPPPRGHLREQTFYLRTGDGAHAPYVQFFAVREKI